MKNNSANERLTIDLYLWIIIVNTNISWIETLLWRDHYWGCESKTHLWTYFPSTCEPLIYIFPVNLGWYVCSFSQSEKVKQEILATRIIEDFVMLAQW